MRVSELTEFMKEQHILPCDSIEALICCLIRENKIDSFMPLMAQYVKQLEDKAEVNKCQLIEAASLLHCRMANLPVPEKENRELHVINQFSNLNCESENEKFGPYDKDLGEKDFKKRYSL